MNTVVVLNSDRMGHADSELGLKILAVFLRKTPMIQGLNSIVLYNDAVKLMTKDSPVLTELHQIRENGVDLLPCITCIEHFGIELAFGKPSNMEEIVLELSKAEKVITL